MGFAQKLQQHHAGQPAYPGGPPMPASAQGQGPPPGQQQQQQQQQQQPQYKAYSAQGPPQGPPGQPQYSQQPQQGGPPPQGGQNVAGYKRLLEAAVQEKGLQGFYPPGSQILDQIANRAGQQVNMLAAQWRIDVEIASDIVKLALYDVILYVDDSGSMQFEENGTRIDDLRTILSRVAFATSLFDDDGIQVRFMNSPQQGNNIRNEQQVNEMVGQTKFSGLTPMGREMQAKVLGPLVLEQARRGNLRKPVLVITITDGQPTGESPQDISNIIKRATEELARNPRYGKGAVAFQFAQVGNDLKAREFLGKLDEDETIGDIIDCTSNYEVEADEMSRAVPPVNLTPDLWLIKLLLGSIDSSYDTKDEKASRRQGGGPGYPPPGGQGYPPQGGPGGYQQGGYPPQGGQGYPPQGGQGYPPQGQGYPPQGGQGYPSQGGQGYPPQGGYRPPQGGPGYPPQGGSGYPPQGGQHPPGPPRY